MKAGNDSSSARSKDEEATQAQAGEIRGGVARGTALALATQLVGGAFTAALTVYLVRALGPASFGVYSLAIGIGALLILPSDFGVSHSAARFVAEIRGDREAVAGVMAAALRLKLITGSVVSVALFATAGPIADAFGEPDLVWPVRAVAVSLFGQNLMLLYSATFVSVGRQSANLLVFFCEGALETIASAALVLAGLGAGGATLGRALAFLAGALIAIVVAARVFGGGILLLRARPGSASRRIVRYAGPLFIVNGTNAVFSQIDVVLIGLMLGSASVGIFSGPLRLTIVLAYAGEAIASSVAPRLARHKRLGSDVTTFEAALRYLFIIQAALLVPILVWARPIVELVLGSSYRESVDVLLALAPFIFLTGFAPLLSQSLNYLGEGHRRVPIVLCALALNVVIDIALIPRLGPVGGAIGSSVAFFFYVLGHFRLCRRMLAFRLRPLAATVLRSVLAAGAMAGVLAAFGTSTLSPTQWLLGASSGFAAFAGVLVLTGEISLSQLHSVLLRVARPDRQTRR
jgi:O-antigen/teichoic acid export membrane protein